MKKLKKQEKAFFPCRRIYSSSFAFCCASESIGIMYDHSKIEIPENYILKPGNNIPERALTNWSELRAYSGIPEQGPLDEETAKLMIHGYYASVSFVDAQIGRLLKNPERRRTR